MIFHEIPAARMPRPFVLDDPFPLAPTPLMLPAWAGGEGAGERGEEARGIGKRGPETSVYSSRWFSPFIPTRIWCSRKWLFVWFSSQGYWSSVELWRIRQGLQMPKRIPHESREKMRCLVTSPFVIYRWFSEDLFQQRELFTDCNVGWQRRQKDPSSHKWPIFLSLCVNCSKTHCLLWQIFTELTLF